MGIWLTLKIIGPSVFHTFSKIIEKIVYKQSMAHLEHYSLLFKYQFGFCCNCLTELAITYFFDLIRRKADSVMATGAILIDLTKAFDTISPSVLLRKLSHYSIHDMELKCFTDYLFLHKQIVHFNGVLSCKDLRGDLCKSGPGHSHWKKVFPQTGISI